MISTEKVWKQYNQELYLFILKKVQGNESVAKDILQNSLLKVHLKLYQLRDPSKIKTWVFQIANHEIVDYFRDYKANKISVKQQQQRLQYYSNQLEENYTECFCCCFDKFLKELPYSYKEVVDLAYKKNKKQTEIAQNLELTLANVKARIRRAKRILKERLVECCKYDVDKKGDLIMGTSNCSVCIKDE